MSIREAAGVYLDVRTLTHLGETVTVNGIVAEAIAHLIDTINKASLTEERTSWQFGGYSINVQTGWVSEDDKLLVRLTYKETRFLALFFITPGKLISEHQLMAELYGHHEVGPDPHILKVMAHEIKRKLRLGGVRIEMVTVYREGRFIRLKT